MSHTVTVRYEHARAPLFRPSAIVTGPKGTIWASGETFEEARESALKQYLDLPSVEIVEVD